MLVYGQYLLDKLNSTVVIVVSNKENQKYFSGRRHVPSVTQPVLFRTTTFGDTCLVALVCPIVLRQMPGFRIEIHSQQSAARRVMTDYICDLRPSCLLLLVF